MIVELATKEIFNDWIELAREVEPLFQGSMAENEEFHNFMFNTIEKGQAFIIHEPNTKKLMGLITISTNKNEITWFAVAKEYRGMGIGSKLLEYAINKLNDKEEIRVITFRKDYKEGIPARRIYEKFGFKDFNDNIFFDGHPRSLMKRLKK